MWFDPSLVVTYRPRSSIRALAKQYFEYGRWRRAVVRSHKGSVNYRYLAAPVAVIINTLSILMGFLVSPLFFLPLSVYLLAILLGGLALGKSTAEKIILPTVFATMHMVWGLGFLTSPKRLVGQDEPE